MAEIVNLRRARRRAARLLDEKQAEQNRILHGTPKGLRSQAQNERERAGRQLEGHYLERRSGGSTDTMGNRTEDETEPGA
ncbi:DUF4169 family protein [Consotaella salsifontis]|uniref:DUF4169 family protein n=1 Tax=Consotaella salsifontis TaxID=1365950 RepID=UPI00099904F5|nr:DUF4169 family protein [Consotaella salsifontis]